MNVDCSKMPADERIMNYRRNLTTMNSCMAIATAMAVADDGDGAVGDGGGAAMELMEHSRLFAPSIHRQILWTHTEIHDPQESASLSERLQEVYITYETTRKLRQTELYRSDNGGRVEGMIYRD